MTIFLVETYVVKPDKLGEFTAFYKKSETWMKKHPELFKEMKSHKLFSHMLGGEVGRLCRDVGSQELGAH